MPGSEQWSPKCPYLSAIGMNFIQCTLHCCLRDERQFDNSNSCNKYADNICFMNFELCPKYHEIYVEEMSTQDTKITHYRECAFCCNSSGYTGLKYNYGGTHCYCQKHQKEVENFNPATVCEWFNKKVDININNMSDLLEFFLTV